MKRKVLLGALAWTLLITIVHVTLNVGWSRVAGSMRFWSAEDRTELVVGFLPVT